MFSNATIFNSQTKTVASAAFLLILSGFASRLLGLIRDRILAGQFGAGDELDIYYAAFQIPDFIYSILFMGAITAAFLPVFTEYWTCDQKEAWRLTNTALNFFLLVLIFVSAILFFLTPQLISIVAPGFSGAKREMTINLTRIMFLSPVFLGASNILGSALQSLRRFFVYSLTPIMYNIGIILGVLFLVPFFGIYGLALGVVLGALLHFAIQIPSIIFSGFRYKAIFDFSHQGFRKIISLMIPRAVGLAANQINVITMTAIASGLAAGSIAIFNLSKNLYYFPVGLFGVSFATAVFPFFAESATPGREMEFQDKFSQTFRQIMFFVMPISVMVYLLRAQIVRLVLGTGKFGWVDTRLTAAALGIFAASIVAQSLIPLISRAFYAMQDTKTPVVIGIMSIALNIVLAFGFVLILTFENQFLNLASRILKIEDLKNISILGLPLAFSLAAIFNFLILIFALQKKSKNFRLDELFGPAFKIFLISILMGIAVYISLRFSAFFADMQTFLGVLLQTAIAGFAALASFIFFAIILRVSEFAQIISSLKSWRRKSL